MSLFSALVKTTVNILTVPVAVTKDVFTLGGIATDQRKSYIEQKLDELKKDSEG